LKVGHTIEMPNSFDVEVLSVGDLRPALLDHFKTSPALNPNSPDFSTGAAPRKPGAYVWSCGEGTVLYIGSAARLAERLGDYRRWISGYDPGSMWEVSVVHMLKRYEAEPRWVQTADHGDALLLERRLIEWHRACVGIAPIVAGWEAKRGSARMRAEQWARDLWGATLGAQLATPGQSQTVQV